MSEAIEKVGRELAASGVLKVGLNLANFLLVSQGDGPVREGVAPDMARELARQLGLAVEFVPYSSPGAMADAARTGDWRLSLRDRRRSSSPRRTWRWTLHIWCSLVRAWCMSIRSIGRACALQSSRTAPMTLSCGAASDSPS